ncbi:dihydroorotase [Xylanibacter brevis]|uniref:dihydroorotase n=1 Tax=Xylanibacter brevis TaxID=83231 RepID=UPI000488F106|nr:dihydroorotase [Xylanibacter brevis]
MKTLIKGATIVNEGRQFKGCVVVEDERIAEILENAEPQNFEGDVIDASGCYLLPGVIDDHVHFREPGLTDKADMESESRAAAAGGVTSFFDMPNCVPQTTTLEALQEKFQLAAEKSHVNYSFFFGATNDNTNLFPQLDIHRIPGIKLFMGSSTGNMLVDRDEALERIFKSTPLPLMAHCEDTAIINKNMEEAKKGYGEDPDVRLHSLIRSEEACLVSTTKAVNLAKKYKARLHVAHVTTAEELELFTPNQTDITAEVCVGHLFFSMLDYAQLGTRIKVNPSIKSPVDQFMLRQSLSDGRIAVVGTDHAPHLLKQKEGGCAKAASGMPMIQFSLVAMLELVDQHVLTIERMVELMAHNPARLFEVRNRGFIRKGAQADLVLVRPNSPWTVTTDVIESKCGWSPLEGHTFQWRVEKTLCNGHLIYNNGQVDRSYIGQPIAFR